MTTKTQNLLSATVVAAFMFVATACSHKSETNNSDTSSNATNTTTTAPAKTDTVVTAPKPPENWSYTEETDKMSNEKQHFASCTSTNQIEFQSPYDGGSTFTILVRNLGKGNDVVLQVSKGQFMTNVVGTYNCRVKFDDEKPMNFDYNSSSDGDATLIFVNNSKKFLSKLRQAKKVMIEAPFYQDGYQIMEFNVAGLIWNN